MISQNRASITVALTKHFNYNYFRASITVALTNTELAFKTNYARTELFRSSYFPRVARLWNNLPISIRKRESLSMFKKDLRLYCLAIDSSDLM